MYTGHGFSDWGIGDVDVIKVGGTYHLFHLVLPHHAYIAHAVSDDGLTKGLAQIRAWGTSRADRSRKRSFIALSRPTFLSRRACGHTRSS